MFSFLQRHSPAFEVVIFFGWVTTFQLQNLLGVRNKHFVCQTCSFTGAAAISSTSLSPQCTLAVFAAPFFQGAPSSETDRCLQLFCATIQRKSSEKHPFCFLQTTTILSSLPSISRLPSLVFLLSCPSVAFKGSSGPCGPHFDCPDSLFTSPRHKRHQAEWSVGRSRGMGDQWGLGQG